VGENNSVLFVNFARDDWRAHGEKIGKSSGRFSGVKFEKDKRRGGGFRRKGVPAKQKVVLGGRGRQEWCHQCIYASTRIPVVKNYASGHCKLEEKSGIQSSKVREGGARKARLDIAEKDTKITERKQHNGGRSGACEKNERMRLISQVRHCLSRILCEEVRR